MPDTSRPRSTQDLLALLGQRTARYRLAIEEAMTELHPGECGNCAAAHRVLSTIEEPPADLITMREAAELLCLSVNAVETFVRKGELIPYPFVGPGGFRGFRRTDVHALRDRIA